MIRSNLSNLSEYNLLKSELLSKGLNKAVQKLSGPLGLWHLPATVKNQISLQIRKMDGNLIGRISRQKIGEIRRETGEMRTGRTRGITQTDSRHITTTSRSGGLLLRCGEGQWKIRSRRLLSQWQGSGRQPRLLSWLKHSLALVRTRRLLPFSWGPSQDRTRCRCPFQGSRAKHLEHRSMAIERGVPTRLGLIRFDLASVWIRTRCYSMWRVGPDWDDAWFWFL